MRHPLANWTKLYTLLMVDPDGLLDSFPTAPLGDLAPARHWALGNLRGSDLITGIRGADATLLDGVDELSPYVAPRPESGSHRCTCRGVRTSQSRIALDLHFEPQCEQMCNGSSSSQAEFASKRSATKTMREVAYFGITPCLFKGTGLGARSPPTGRL